MSEPASHVSVQPAATVMLVRDAITGEAGGSLEVLMLRRHPEAVFAADAWVFPGGRVEEADILLARHAGSGAWLDASGEWGAARLARYRREVHAGATTLAAVLEAEGLVLDLSGIHYVSHWITPPGPTARRFDTRFFVAECPPGQVASHDAAETVESFWAPPAEALARGEAGEIQLLIPTIANLRALARFSSVAGLVAAARSIGSVPLAAPRFRGDPAVPAGVLSPLDPESSCPT